MHEGASVVPIPATREAQRSRGFDHGASLAQAVAEYLHAPCARLLEPPCAKDQRELTRGERFANMEAAFSLQGVDCDFHIRNVILVDDVFTTGATLFAAAATLRAAGVEHVRCATFARVY